MAALLQASLVLCPSVYLGPAALGRVIQIPPPLPPCHAAPTAFRRSWVCCPPPPPSPPPQRPSRTPPPASAAPPRTAPQNPSRSYFTVRSAPSIVNALAAPVASDFCEIPPGEIWKHKAAQNFFRAPHRVPYSGEFGMTSVQCTIPAFYQSHASYMTPRALSPSCSPFTSPRYMGSPRLFGRCLFRASSLRLPSPCHRSCGITSWARFRAA